MGVTRHLLRQVALQTLYEWDFCGDGDLDKILTKNIEEFIGKDIEKKDLKYLYSLIHGIETNREDIDNLIRTAAPEWPLEQIAYIDKNVLRIAIFELIFSEDIPPKVAINEAVELAKAFGGENSSKFVNGVLGTIYRSSKRYVPEDSAEEKKATEERVNEKKLQKKSKKNAQT